MTGYLTVWDAEADAPREVLASEAVALGLPVLVYDTATGQPGLISAAGLAGNMLAYARTLPAGSAHRAEVERQALEITGPPWAKKPRKPKAAVKGKSGT